MYTGTHVALRFRLEYPRQFKDTRYTAALNKHGKSVEHALHTWRTEWSTQYHYEFTNNKKVRTIEKSVLHLCSGIRQRATDQRKTICEVSQKICSRDPSTTFRLNLGAETALPFVYRTRSTISHLLRPSLVLYPSAPSSVAPPAKGWLLEKGLEVIAFPLTRVYRVAEDGEGRELNDEVYNAGRGEYT